MTAPEPRPRVSDERLADLVARRNLGPGISHNEVADLIDELRDERAARVAVEQKLEEVAGKPFSLVPMDAVLAEREKRMAAEARVEEVERERDHAQAKWQENMERAKMVTFRAEAAEEQLEKWTEREAASRIEALAAEVQELKDRWTDDYTRLSGEVRRMAPVVEAAKVAVSLLEGIALHMAAGLYDSSMTQGGTDVAVIRDIGIFVARLKRELAALSEQAPTQPEEVMPNAKRGNRSPSELHATQGAAHPLNAEPVTPEGPAPMENPRRLALDLRDCRSELAAERLKMEKLTKPLVLAGREHPQQAQGDISARRWQCKSCGAEFPHQVGDEDVDSCTKCVELVQMGRRVRDLEARLAAMSFDGADAVGHNAVLAAEVQRLREKNQELNRRAQEEYSRGVKDCASKRSAGRSLHQARAETAEAEVGRLRAALERLTELRNDLSVLLAKDWPRPDLETVAKTSNILEKMRAALSGSTEP